jgi:hypothetical protein
VVQLKRRRADDAVSHGPEVHVMSVEAQCSRVDCHPTHLRRNGGGDSHVIGPLKRGLTARRNKLGKFYVLIGPGTFSSAVDNAIELQRSLGAVFVGEPSGGKPSSYGEVKQVALPNSKLVVQYTSKWFGSHKDSEPGDLTPAIPAPRTLVDLIAERDPALTAALTAGR